MKFNSKNFVESIQLKGLSYADEMKILRKLYTRIDDIKKNNDWMNFPKLKTRLYNGAILLNLEKGSLTDYTHIEVTFQSKGWWSIKYLEDLDNDGEVRKQVGNGWKKLDTVRQVEIISLSETTKRVKIPLSRFYCKPFNVAAAAWIRGLISPPDPSRIMNIEITSRIGTLAIKEIVIS